MELPQFLQYRIRLLEAWMSHRFVAGNTSQGQSAKPLGDPDTTGPLVNTARFIHTRLAAVVAAMACQVVSNPHQRAPQTAIGLADDGATINVR